MKLIEKIEIKYFRSFGEKNVKIIKLEDLNIFSGSNDVGKSNVLKALNLFFNNQTNIGEEFDLKKDLSFLQRNRSQKKLEEKRETRTKDDPHASQRDLFVKIKIFFNRPIPYEKSTTPENFWVEKTWNKNGFNKLTSNIQQAYKKKNDRVPTQNQAAALQGQLTQFLNSINYEYIPAIKDRKFLQYLFKKLQNSLFERDDSFKETSNEINTRITDTTQDLFSEFRDKTGIDAGFSIPESLIDFFTTINVSTENDVSLYSRGDGIQARFIPAILNEISKGKKNIIWGFEEPENSYEYRNAELLADDFLNIYSLNKQIFITSHTKEFLSLIKGNEHKVSLHRVYKTLKRGSLVDTYQEDRGFDKEEIQKRFWEGVGANDKGGENKDILNKIFEDIGFLENDQYIIDDLQNQLKNQRIILEKSGLEIEKRTLINDKLIKNIQDAILDKEALEKEIEEYKKPILYVEDKYDQIYKIAYLKIKEIECNMDNFESLFNQSSPFIIRRGESAGKLAGRLRAPNNDGYENKKIIGLFDFDKEGLENFSCLKKEKFWENDIQGDKGTGHYKKRSDHKCFFALLLPVPTRLNHLADISWDNFISYIEIENLLPETFITKENIADKKNSPAGKYFKIKKDKKSDLWKKLFKLNKDDFIDFKPLFDKVINLFEN